MVSGAHQRTRIRALARFSLYPRLRSLSSAIFHAPGAPWYGFDRRFLLGSRGPLCRRSEPTSCQPLPISTVNNAAELCIVRLVT